MRRYAEGTAVPAEKSRHEIEALLIKHGASGFQTGWDAQRGVSALLFRMNGRMLRFYVSRPEAQEFATSNRVRDRRDAPATSRRFVMADKTGAGR